MSLDQSQSQSSKVKSFQNLTTGSLSSSISELSGSSRGIPSGKDFHFFYNFEEFKSPIQEITKHSQSMLETIGSSARIWTKDMAYPQDLDDAYDWLVNVNDEVFERFDMSVDEFQRLRKIEEETGKPVMDLDDGFQLVCGKKKNKGALNSGSGSASESVNAKDDLSVKVATKDKKVTGTKPKVPFHIPTIRKPQEEFNILVNNLNQPFEHVWLQRNEDDQRFIHPLENLSVLDFVDQDIAVEPSKPPPIDSTPFKLVEEVKDLKMLAAKLHSVNEFAVDLEHNQYRSFQGLTCLMQISTRTEDFVVDTLKLRIHIGPYLREVFKDPTKKKVMHGADRDIIWLQRDFGIYICNLFDTGQASRVLKLERNSLEYLLYHFCEVTANKEYQNAEWRLRPLPDEMIRYAREDTHYLLYIYDLMKLTLLSMSKEPGNPDSPLVEVYKRSYDVCMQLYEKEILTENSYLYVYGLQGAGFNVQQVAIVAGLCEWRDVVARAEDESTGYIMPNRTLLEIAKEMPVTTSKLRWLLKSKHPYIERNLGSVVSIIRHSIQNSPAFEAAAEHLKEGRLEMPSVENTVSNNVSEVVSPDTPSNSRTTTATTETIVGGSTLNGNISPLSSASVQHTKESLKLEYSTELARDGQGVSSSNPSEIGKVNIESGIYSSETPKKSIVMGQTEMAPSDAATSVTGATIRVAKKPTSAFGALLGNTASKRRLDTSDEICKEEMKLEQIRCSVNLPFNSFVERNDQPKPAVEGLAKALKSQQPDKPLVDPVSSPVEDVILLEDNSNIEEYVHDESESNNEHTENNSVGSALETDEGELMSLPELSTSFQKCFNSSKQSKKSGLAEQTEESGSLFQLKPFNYEAARKQVNFGDQKEGSGVGSERDPKNRHDSGSRRKNSSVSRAQRENETSDFQQGRRRHAFPATGNRSATFR